MVDEFGIPGLTGYEEIGAGGFASVYAAFEPDAGRRVAVKVLRAADEQARRRFDRERRTLGRTTEHVNIVTMFRSGFTEQGGHPYLVMEYLPGGSLQDRLATRTPLPTGEAVELTLQVADALGFAHGAGILHKDVKPANILLTSTGMAKLGDFGISAVRDATGTSQMGFSLAYAPPETFEASAGADGRYVDQRDERSDLYSLAATLYALVVGAAPFEAENAAAAMHRILTESPAPTGDPGLDRFFATALARDPDRRFPTAGHFADALLAAAPAASAPSPASGPPALADLPPTSVLATSAVPAPGTLVSDPAFGVATTPAPPSGRRRVRRGPVVAAVIAVGLAAAGVAAIAWSDLFPGPADTADEASGTSAESLASGEVEVADGGATDGQVEGGADGAIDGDGTTGDADDATDDNTIAVTSEEAVDDADPVDGATDDGETSSGADTGADNSAGTADATGGDSTTDPTAGNDDAVAGTGSNARTLAAEPTVVGILDPGTRTNNVVELRNGLLASYHFQTGVRLWSRDDPGTTVGTYTGHSGGVGALVELADGRLASGGSSGDRTVRIWDPTDPGTTLATYRGHRTVDSISALLQLDNGWIVSGGVGGEVHIWDPADPDTTIDTYDGHRAVIITDLVQLRNGLVLSNGEGDGAHVWNPSNPASTAATYSVSGAGAGGYTYDVVELDNGLLVSDTLSGTIQVWNPNDSSGPVGVYRAHGGNVGGLVALDGGLVASGGPNGQVHIWDSTDPDTTLLTYSGHIGPVFSVTQLDSGLIASTASDQVHLWDPYRSGG